MPLSSKDSTCRSSSRGICNVCHCWKIRLYTPPPCPHSWSNNFLFIAQPARIYNCCCRAPAAAKNLFATCNRWVGGEPGGNRTTIFGPAIKSWEVRHCLTWFLLFQASHSRKIPDRKGEKAEWRTIPSRCLKTPSSSCCAVFISEIRGPCLQRPLTAV